MTIKLVCDDCGNITEMDANVYMHSPEQFCKCGGELRTQISGAMIKEDLNDQVKDNVDRWFKKLGIEKTIEIVEKNQHRAMARLYKEELERRGLKVKFDD